MGLLKEAGDEVLSLWDSSCRTVPAGEFLKCNLCCVGKGDALLETDLVTAAV